MEAQRYAVVMAGGHGTRFWPLSRTRRPKQLLKMLGSKSLVRQSVDRIRPLFPSSNILVVTLGAQLRAVRRELPFLPAKNFLVEPEGHNTAPCLGLAALELISRSPDAVMAVFPADHWIGDARSFRRTIREGCNTVREHDVLMTMGVKPLYAETGFGYIVKGAPFKTTGRIKVSTVKSFREKPSLRTATRIIRDGALWNSGIFIWRAATILKMLAMHSPTIYGGLQWMQKNLEGFSLGNPGRRLRSVLQKGYSRMPHLSIDHAVLEKAGRGGKVLIMEANFAWNDVGSWAALHRLLPRDRNGYAGSGRWVGLDSNDCLVLSPKRLVAILGLSNVVVVDSPDALLVADMDRSQDLKGLVDALKGKGHDKFLH